MKALAGRLLQLTAMILLPVGLLYGLGLDDIATEVRLLALGGALFVAGWWLAREKSG